MEDEVETVEVVLPPPAPRSKFEREREAFFRLLPGLVATHRGKHVAIHDEQVIDADDDPLVLISRVRHRLGNQALYVELVTDQSRPRVRIPSFRVRADPA